MTDGSGTGDSEVQLDLLAELAPGRHRVMVTPNGDRWLVSSMTELGPADRCGDLYTSSVRAQKWVDSRRVPPHWGPEISFHVNTDSWTEEAT